MQWAFAKSIAISFVSACHNSNNKWWNKDHLLILCHQSDYMSPMPWYSTLLIIAPNLVGLTPMGSYVGSNLYYYHTVFKYSNFSSCHLNVNTTHIWIFLCNMCMHINKWDSFVESQFSQTEVHLDTIIILTTTSNTARMNNKIAVTSS